ncbi:MAG TPA: sulfite exporter TauE/SafE family protein [Rhodocyclaceae bacterium]
MVSSESLVLIAAVFLLAGWVKGIVGMGLPTVVMGALALAMPPAEAAALLIVPSLATNLRQFLAGPSPWKLARRMASLLLFICIGTALGIPLLTASATHWPALALGAVLAVYALIGLFARPFVLPPDAARRWAPAVGGLTGVLTGATGVFVVPAVPYLSALGLSRDELVQALGISFTVSTIALGVALGVRTSYSPTLLALSVGAVLPALLGMALGQATRSRIAQAVFRRWFFTAMLAVGLTMLARGLLAM